MATSTFFMYIYIYLSLEWMKMLDYPSHAHKHTHTILWLYSYALWPVNQGQNHYGLLNDRDFTSICKPEVTFEVSPSVPSIPGDELSSWKLDSTALTIHSCVCISLIPFYASNHRCGLEFTFLYSQKYTHTQLWMRGIDWSTSACVLIHLARLVAYMFFCAPMPPPPPHLFIRSSFLDDLIVLVVHQNFY